MYDYFIDRLEVAALDFFPYQSLGFRFEFDGHTCKLAASTAGRKLLFIRSFRSWRPHYLLSTGLSLNVRMGSLAQLPEEDRKLAEALVRRAESTTK